MAFARPMPAAERLPTSYQGAVDQHLRFYSRATCVVAMVLIACGVGLDLAFYR